MRDIILQCAGVAGILVAIIHGVLGETKVFAQATIQPESLRTLIRIVWQAGTVAWIGGGVLLIAAPWFGSESARHWIMATIDRGLRLCRRSGMPGGRAAAALAGRRSASSWCWRSRGIECVFPCARPMLGSGACMVETRLRRSSP